MFTLSNNKILPFSLASQLCTITEDDSVDNIRDLVAHWSISEKEAKNMKEIHGLDVESEIEKSVNAEVIQEFDNHLISEFLQNALFVESFDLSEHESKDTYIGQRFERLVTHIKEISNSFENKNNLALIVSPMIISVLQSAAKSVFVPAVEGSFKGPNNTMKVGEIVVDEDDVEKNIDVYCFLFNILDPNFQNYPVLLIDKKVSKVDVHSEMILKEKQENGSTKLKSNYEIKIEPKSVRKIMVVVDISFI